MTTNLPAAQTITCAWCGTDIPRAAGVDADSHGICGPCADEWQDEGDYQLSRALAAREIAKLGDVPACAVCGMACDGLRTVGGEGHVCSEPCKTACVNRALAGPDAFDAVRR